MLERLKGFTQSITKLIMVALGLFIIPFAMTKILQVLNVIEWTDKLFGQSLVIFWISFIATRLTFAWVWVKVYELVQNKGEQLGFFWFEQPEEEDGWDRGRRLEKEMKERQRVDKTDEIVINWVIAPILLFVIGNLFAEIAIRLFSLTLPPYLM